MPKRVKGWDDRKWLVPVPKPRPDTQQTTLRLSGTVPPEVWNRLGTKMLPKLRSGDDLSVGIKFSPAFTNTVTLAGCTRNEASYITGAVLMVDAGLTAIQPSARQLEEGAARFLGQTRRGGPGAS